MNEIYMPLVTSNFIVGRGSINYISQLNKKRVAVIHGRRSMPNTIKEKIKKLIECNGGECRFVAEITNEPFLSDIIKATEEMKAFQPDMIIAIGGGSVMDTAKAIHLFYEYPDMNIEDSFIPYNLPTLGKKALMIAIPTTSGTGSETTSVAVFIDDATKTKHLMLSNELIPHYAIIDADLTDSLPNKVAAHTGMDALTHALEAAVCTKASPMVLSIALSAALDIIENLEASVSDHTGEAVRVYAREACHVAASLAGVSITNACAGLAHGFDQPGPYFGLPHGMVCGILLPYTTSFVGPQKAYTMLAKRIGLRGNSDTEQFQNLVNYLFEFNKTVGIPTCFAELGIRETEFLDKLEDFATLAISAVATKLSPKIPDLREAKKLLRDSYYGNKPKYNTYSLM